MARRCSQFPVPFVARLYSLSIFHKTNFRQPCFSAIGCRTLEFAGQHHFLFSWILYSRNTAAEKKDIGAEISVLLTETGQEATQYRVKRKAIRRKGWEGWEEGKTGGLGGREGVAEGESKVVLAIRVRTSMCRRFEYLECTGWLALLDELCSMFSVDFVLIYFW